MGYISQADLLEFIAANANPTVSLAVLNKHFGTESRETIRMHLGALYRAEKIDRQNGNDGTVAYWTSEHTKAAIAKGFKSSRNPPNPPVVQASVAATNYLAPGSTAPNPLAVPPDMPMPDIPPREQRVVEKEIEAAVVEEPAFETVQAEPKPEPEPEVALSTEQQLVEHQAVVAAQTDVPAVEEVRTSSVGKAPRLPPGSLRRPALTATVALSLYHHDGKAYTLDQIERMHPEVSREDLFRVLNVLLTKGYADRTIKRPYAWNWNGNYDYPCAAREDNDVRLFIRLPAEEKTGGDIIQQTAIKNDSNLDAKVVLGPVHSFENCRRQNDRRRPDPEVHSVADKFPEVALAKPEAKVGERSCIHPEGCQSCNWCGFKSEETKPEQFTGTINLSTNGDTSFSASLSTEGRLEMVIADCLVALGPEQLHKLITLIGPHYNPDIHRI